MSNIIIFGNQDWKLIKNVMDIKTIFLEKI